MAQTSWEYDEKARQLTDNLKTAYDVTANAAVIERALVIADIANKHADADGYIHRLC